MDKEALDLVEDVRKALVAFAKTQTSDSAKKKTRKVTSEVIWSPGPYLDELDNILSTSKNKNEAIMRVRSLVRAAEQSGIEDMRFLPDDTPHHLVQTRTGGDDLTEVDYRRSGPIIERLSEKHKRTFGSTTGPTGNLPAELSLSNAAHKFDDRATGLERQSGIGKAIPKEKTAHPRGTAGFANMKGVDMTDDAAIEAALDRKVTSQIDIAQTAIQSDAPRQAAVRDMFPGAYQGAAADVARARPVLTPENTPGLMESYRKLKPGGGSMRFNAIGQLSKVPVLAGLAVGTATLATGGTPAQALSAAVQTENPIEDLDAGPLFDEREDYGLVLKKTKEQNARPLMDRLNEGALGDMGAAIKRGPKMHIQAGSMRFGIHEFGISELLGIN